WPIGAAVLLTMVLLFILRAASSLATWTEVYGPTGGFTVEECSTEPNRLGARIECGGSLEPAANPQPTSSVLVGPKSAFGSILPSSGDVIEAYHRVGDTSRSFPVEGRSIELARAMIGVVPLVFIAGGLACWLLGWLLTHGASREDRERCPDHYRWPARFVLRPRGAMWAAVGLVWLVFDRYAVGDLLGSAGLS
ncbi:MAG: hypothetical protein OEV40_30660, partial [Acidimicrobiia bacterium]|nr:hypothetical protein [Acidimicrobiia bacterium]